MGLAIFDLDNTLIAGDSDFLWGQFLADKGVVDKVQYQADNAKFYEDYQAGKLDIVKFLHFSLAPLAHHDAKKLQQWRTQFISQIIMPIVLKPAIRLVNKHRFRGDTVIIVTATNYFITEPIAKLFAVDHLLATMPELIDGQYTGKFMGTPCFQEGKIALLLEWLKLSTQNISLTKPLEKSWFYSDSYNDISLLKWVEHPVAVDPDKKLLQHANQNNWSIISLR